MTTTEITWGDPIDAANDGKPLPWLKEDEEVYCIWGEDTHSGPYPVYCITGWNEGFQIRLPADHPYYLATSRGFTYWPGDDNAPADWDGKEVLHRAAELVTSTSNLSWTHPWRDGGNARYDIIGYRKRAEAVEDNDDYIRVKRMTLDEAGHNGYHIETLAALGLLKFETPLEQFEREFGALNLESRHAVRAFIEGQSRNG